MATNVIEDLGPRASNRGQIYLIINDSDVKSFIKKAIQGRASQIVPGNLKQRKAHLGRTTEDEEEELPF